MTRTLVILGMALGLSACDDMTSEPYQAYWDHPKDAQVTIMAMEKCLAATKGPLRTQYNDWDEAIEACKSFANDASRYCPDDQMAKCLPQYRRTRAEVRLALPKEPST